MVNKMSLLEQWRNTAYSQEISQQQSNALWERYFIIEKSVGAVLEQTFGDFELLIVNDFSPDRSAEICEKIASEDQRIKIVHQKNKGPSSARNAGLKICTGKYVTFVVCCNLFNSSIQACRCVSR